MIAIIRSALALSSSASGKPRSANTLPPEGVMCGFMRYAAETIGAAGIGISSPSRSMVLR